jgi:hypothetical protein
MFARIGVMQALNRHHVREFNTDRKPHHWRKRKLKRDQWADHVRLSDLEPRFVCKACGKRGADVRPDFNWNKLPMAAMGYRAV